MHEARRLKPPVDHIVGINRGGAIIGGCIAKKLGFPNRGKNSFFLLYVCTENPEDPDDPCANPPVLEQRDDGIDINEDHVILLVDDSMRTADHMRAAMKYLRNRYGKNIAIKKFVLLDASAQLVGPEDYKQELRPDAYAFKTGGAVFWPWDPDEDLKQCRENRNLVQGTTLSHLFISHQEHGAEPES